MLSGPSSTEMSEIRLALLIRHLGSDHLARSELHMRIMVVGGGIGARSWWEILGAGSAGGGWSRSTSRKRVIGLSL
jgi:hypothetical protein